MSKFLQKELDKIYATQKKICTSTVKRPSPYVLLLLEYGFGGTEN